MPQEQQFDFLRVFIERILDQNGFDNLTEETRAQYIPQFIAEAERRLGLAVMPKLTPETAEELANLLPNKNLTSDQLRDFWYRSVPDFDSMVKQTLDDFAKEIGGLVAEIK